MTSAPDTRASLILRLQSTGDSRGWDEFVDIYQPVVYRTARRHGLNHDDALEVVQEVLARLTKAIASWNPDPDKGSFRGWLYRITKNISIDFLRKARRQPLTGDPSGLLSAADQRQVARDEQEFDRELERQIFRAAANKIQHQFAPSTWSAFWSTAVEGKPVEQMAEELRMSRGAVYIARSRVMARLKQAVSELMNETLGSEPSEIEKRKHNHS